LKELAGAGELKEEDMNARVTNQLWLLATFAIFLFTPVTGVFGVDEYGIGVNVAILPRFHQFQEMRIPSGK
jgi:hypothetical protein